MLQFLEATGGEVPAGIDAFSGIFMLLLMVAIFYFMLIRPENKRKKEAENMRSQMKVGDNVTTIGGITGKIVSIKDDSFVLETGADQVRIEFKKWGLSSNDTADAAAKEEAKKKEEAKAKAKAEKKVKKADK